jgi:hypothetical protein
MQGNVRVSPRYHSPRRISLYIQFIGVLLGTIIGVQPLPLHAQSTTYYVSPTGTDAASGTSPGTPFGTIQHAVDLAQPGVVIQLATGNYYQDIVSQRSGSLNAPITITGPASAIVHGGGSSHIVDIHHNHLTLQGFTIDGLFGSPTEMNGYRNKLLYVIGTRPREGVSGLRVLSMTFRNAGGECLRLRYFAQHNEVAYSSFTNCGVYDFRFHAGTKNGEGIYIGTSPLQIHNGRNPTTHRDPSSDNWIHHNTFNTQGNECVDIKEASFGNIVEFNRCTGQQDPKSGGFDARGNNNIFRYNEIYGNVGAGVRLGGQTTKDGILNAVYGNHIHDNQAGGIKFQRAVQAQICDNTMSNNAGDDFRGAADVAQTPRAQCPSSASYR